MTGWARSLYGRLLLVSLLATLVALGVGGVAIGGILERFVTQGLDDRLDAQIAVLAGAVRPDGGIDRARVVLAAPYRDPDSGWGWRIDSPRGRLASPGGADLPIAGDPPEPPRVVPPPGPPPGPPHGPPDDGAPRPFDWRGPDGGGRHGRRLVIATAAGPATIAAAAPRSVVRRPIRAAMAPLIGSLGLLGLLLALATLVQLRLGLRPLARLRAGVAAVRAGTADRLPDDQPAELAPLAAELNALVDQNARRLAQARGHVANLAHGLKTPLAALALDLRDGGRDPDGRLAASVERIDAAIRHHLGRARADAAGGRSGVAVGLAAAVADLAAALARIHADRGVAFAVDVPPDLAIAVDPRDLDELLGNLLDNGWRHARGHVAVTAVREGAGAAIRIADDGLGIPAAVRAEAMRPGRRLDEGGEGHGFGLAIARELAELYGGTLALGEAQAGGLLVELTLPAAGG